MRFVYNLKTYERLKSSAAITYPRELILEGQKYDLRGVVSHIGRNVSPWTQCLETNSRRPMAISFLRCTTKSRWATPR